MASESRSETDPLGPKGLEPEEREPRIGAPDPEEIGGALLEELLLEDPCSFEFFQAVRLLRRLRPSLEGVGQFAHPSREVVRFSSNPRLGFPAGQVQELEQDPRQTLRMEVNFMGLVGNQGVLPLHYSRMVRRQEKENQDHPLRDFLDIFQHRIVSLFYRAWERARFFVPFERGEGDPVSARVYDLLGLGGPELRGRMGVPDDSLLFYPQLLAPRQRTVWSLAELIRDYLEVPVEVQQFVGGWYPLAREARCELDDDPGSGAPRLGMETIVGDEIWDPQAKARIRLGPLSREEYEDFLPRGKGFRALKALTAFFGDGNYDFEVQLVLDREEAPLLELGREEEGTPLGWLTWIQTRPLTRDPDETTLTL